MAYNHIDRAKILVEALPYIQKYSGKTIVVKYGGNAMISEDLRTAVMSDIILLRLVGINVVVVHGGGPEINEMLKKIGKNLVATLNRMGGKAMGLCGMDASLFEAKVKDAKYGLVGEIVKVNPQVVQDCIDDGYIPVVSTVAQGMDAQTAYNINADTAAAKLATALKAEKLILLTDVRGLLRDPKDEETLIHIVHMSDVPMLKKTGVIQGGMIPKVECCVEAVRSGVKRSHILDGRIPHSILIEMLSDKGIGTMLL